MRPRADVLELLELHVSAPAARIATALCILGEMRRRLCVIVLMMRFGATSAFLDRLAGTHHAAVAKWIEGCNAAREQFRRAPSLVDVLELLKVADAVLNGSDAAKGGGGSGGGGGGGADELALFTSRKRAAQMLAFGRHLQTTVRHYEQQTARVQQAREAAAAAAMASAVTPTATATAAAQGDRSEGDAL